MPSWWTVWSSIYVHVRAVKVPGVLWEGFFTGNHSISDILFHLAPWVHCSYVSEVKRRGREIMGVPGSAGSFPCPECPTKLARKSDLLSVLLCWRFKDTYCLLVATLSRHLLQRLNGIICLCHLADQVMPPHHSLQIYNFLTEPTFYLTSLFIWNSSNSPLCNEKLVSSTSQCGFRKSIAAAQNGRCLSPRNSGTIRTNPATQLSQQISRASQEYNTAAGAPVLFSWIIT